MQWYARFERYRLLGPTRTIQAVWRQESVGKSKCPGQRWYEVFAYWKWQERAVAWDHEERQRLRAEMAADAERRRRRMLRIANKALEKIEAAVDALQPQTLTAADTVRIWERAETAERSAIVDGLAEELTRKVEQMEQAMKPEEPG